MRKKNKYYVVYMLEGKTGCVVISLNGKIDTYKTIQQVAEYISKEYCNGSKVLIVNYKRLKRE